jgi:hypothetical protein
MRVLDVASCFLGARHLEGRYIYGSHKVQDVLCWNVPMSVGDIWSFLGLAGYY